MNLMQDILDQDLDPVETKEWIDALHAVIGADGPERAHYLLERMVDETRRAGGHIPFTPTTQYVNTIPAHAEPKNPGDATLEWKLRSLRSEEHTSELQSQSNLVCRLLLEKKKK